MPGVFDRGVWLHLQQHGLLPDEGTIVRRDQQDADGNRDGKQSHGDRRRRAIVGGRLLVYSSLSNFDGLLAKDLTVWAHDRDAPVAGLEAPLAVRAIACGRIWVDEEADILP